MVDVETITVRRVMPRDGATHLVGTVVPRFRGIVLPRRLAGAPPLLIHDETGELIAILTRLPEDRTSNLRAVVTQIEAWNGVARAAATPAGTTMQRAKARTFGYAPRKPNAWKEGCHPTTMMRDHGGASAILAELAGYFGRQFEELFPERARADRETVNAVRDDWLLDDDGLWTSGVVNKTAILPYHRDGANLNTWSAMPTLRHQVDGGVLHLPEYDMAFPCRDGEVAWFCGRDLVHGVTPMTVKRTGGYRFSVVYYAMKGMVDCRTYAEETANALVARTERERKMASEATG